MITIADRTPGRKDRATKMILTVAHENFEDLRKIMFDK